MSSLRNGGRILIALFIVYEIIIHMKLSSTSSKVRDDTVIVEVRKQPLVSIPDTDPIDGNGGNDDHGDGFRAEPLETPVQNVVIGNGFDDESVTADSSAGRSTDDGRVYIGGDDDDDAASTSPTFPSPSPSPISFTGDGDVAGDAADVFNPEAQRAEIEPEPAVLPAERGQVEKQQVAGDIDDARDARPLLGEEQGSGLGSRSAPDVFDVPPDGDTATTTTTTDKVDIPVEVDPRYLDDGYVASDAEKSKSPVDTQSKAEEKESEGTVTDAGDATHAAAAATATPTPTPTITSLPNTTLPFIVAARNVTLEAEPASGNDTSAAETPAAAETETPQPSETAAEVNLLPEEDGLAKALGDALDSDSGEDESSASSGGGSDAVGNANATASADSSNANATTIVNAGTFDSGSAPTGVAKDERGEMNVTRGGTEARSEPASERETVGLDIAKEKEEGSSDTSPSASAGGDSASFSFSSSTGGSGSESDSKSESESESESRGDGGLGSGNMIPPSLRGFNGTGSGAGDGVGVMDRAYADVVRKAFGGTLVHEAASPSPASAPVGNDLLSTMAGEISIREIPKQQSISTEGKVVFANLARRYTARFNDTAIRIGYSAFPLPGRRHATHERLVPTGARQQCERVHPHGHYKYLARCRVQCEVPCVWQDIADTAASQAFYLSADAVVFPADRIDFTDAARSAGKKNGSNADGTGDDEALGKGSVHGHPRMAHIPPFAHKRTRANQLRILYDRSPPKTHPFERDPARMAQWDVITHWSRTADVVINSWRGIGNRGERELFLSGLSDEEKEALAEARRALELQKKREKEQEEAAAAAAAAAAKATSNIATNTTANNNATTANDTATVGTAAATADNFEPDRSTPGASEGNPAGDPSSTTSSSSSLDRRSDDIHNEKENKKPELRQDLSGGALLRGAAGRQRRTGEDGPAYAAAFLADSCSRDGSREARVRQLAAEPLGPRVVAIGRCQVSGRVKQPPGKKQPPRTDAAAGNHDVKGGKGRKSEGKKTRKTLIRASEQGSQGSQGSKKKKKKKKVKMIKQSGKAAPGRDEETESDDGAFGDYTGRGPSRSLLADAESPIDPNLDPDAGTTTRPTTKRAAAPLLLPRSGPHRLPSPTAARLRDDVTRMRKYPFTLAYEMYNATDWVTTALVAPLLAGSVPVYWGDRSAALSVLPHRDAAVFADDFGDAAHLAAYLWRTLREPGGMDHHLAWRRDPSAVDAFLAKLESPRPTPCEICALVAQSKLESRFLSRRRWRVWQEGEGWVEHLEEDIAMEKPDDDTVAAV